MLSDRSTKICKHTSKANLEAEEGQVLEKIERQHAQNEASANRHNRSIRYNESDGEASISSGAMADT